MLWKSVRIITVLWMRYKVTVLIKVVNNEFQNIIHWFKWPEALSGLRLLF